jgi:branched-chain amino acid transport system permease protein
LGGFYAHYYGILTPDVMATSHTVEVLAVAYIGGGGGGTLTAPIDEWSQIIPAAPDGKPSG